VGECSFWYRPTRVVPDQRPLNGRCVVVVVVDIILMVTSVACCMRVDSGSARQVVREVWSVDVVSLTEWFT